MTPHKKTDLSDLEPHESIPDATIHDNGKKVQLQPEGKHTGASPNLFNQSLFRQGTN